MTRSLPALALLLLLAVSAAGAGERLGVIAGDEVRLRAGPGTRHAILAEADRDQPVVIVGTEGRWKRVRVPGGFACWVHSSLVRRDGAEAVVTGSRVLLRPTAGQGLLPLETVLDRGEVLLVLGEEGEWLRVIAPERACLYVFDELVRDAGPAEEHRERIVAAAAARREALLSGRPEEELRREREARQRELEERALALGEQVLGGGGESGALARDLRGIALTAEDDLTRAYVESLLALLGLRAEVEELRAGLESLAGSAQEERVRLEAALAAARDRYERALEEARALRYRREQPFRGVGVIERRADGFALVEDGKTLYLLESSRFRLADYVGKRVGVSGRMASEDESRGAIRLMVDRLEIFPAEPGGR